MNGRTDLLPVDFRQENPQRRKRFLVGYALALTSLLCLTAAIYGTLFLQRSSEFYDLPNQASITESYWHSSKDQKESIYHLDDKGHMRMFVLVTPTAKNKQEPFWLEFSQATKTVDGVRYSYKWFDCLQTEQLTPVDPDHVKVSLANKPSRMEEHIEARDFNQRRTAFKESDGFFAGWQLGEFIKSPWHCELAPVKNAWNKYSQKFQILPISSLSALAIFPSAQAATAETNNPFATTDDYAYAGEVWRPLLSKVAPGLDQYVAGQYAWGGVYTGVGIGAKVWEHDASIKVKRFKDRPRYTLVSDEEKLNFKLQNNLFREQMMAAKAFDITGDVSAYHSFRTALVRRQKYGEYTFIDTRNTETPQELALSPFQFSYLQRPTTWIPLAATAAFWAILNNNHAEEIERDSYTGSDAGYATGLAYEAGMGEEAFWRGYFQPVLREYTTSSLAANLIQSALFMASHANGNAYHFGYGYYMGWLNEHNGWRLGESIFVHSWADVISISASYSIRLKTPVLAVPALNLAF